MIELNKCLCIHDLAVLYRSISAAEASLKKLEANASMVDLAWNEYIVESITELFNNEKKRAGRA